MIGRALLGGVAFLGLCVGTARASDTSDLESLLNENVVTTASGVTEIDSTAPAVSSILTANDIRIYGIHSLNEAIDFLSLGLVTSNSLATVEGGARGVLITKDNVNHFRLLINGHAVNEPYFSSVRIDRGTAVPIEMIDHIECILGPGSLLYGNNAMLGVINIVTKYSKDYSGSHAVVETEILKSYRIAGGVGYSFPLFGKPTELTLGIEYYTQNGPAFTLGPQYVGDDPQTGTLMNFSPTGPATGIWGGVANQSYFSNVPSGFARLVFGDFTLMVHALTYKRSAPYGSTLGQSFEDFNDPATYELDRRLEIDLKFRKSLTPIIRLQARLYSDSFDYQQHIQASSYSGCSNLASSCMTEVLAISRWLGLETQMSLNWLRDNRLVTLLGFDGQVRSIESQTDVIDGTTGPYLTSSVGKLDTVDAIIGAYLQQTWQPRTDLGFNGGVRLDYDPRFTPAFSPRVAVVYNAAHGITLKAIYTQAFRAPSWYETSAYNFTLVRSSGLQLEREQSIELFMEKKFLTNRLFFGFFQTWWTDLVSSYQLTAPEIVTAIQEGEIPFTPGITKVSQLRNITTVDNTGFNAGIEGRVRGGQFSYALNVTGAIARQNSNSNENSLPVTPKIFGNLRASYDFRGPWPVVAVAAHVLGWRFASGVDVGLVVPQLEIRATLSGRAPLLKGLTYRFSANYAASSQSPYLIGPGGPILSQYGSAPTDVELAPVDQFRTTAGLQYDFL